jgi:hypothetical protein
MRRGNHREPDLLPIEQAIGRFKIVPALKLVGQTGGRVIGDVVGHLNEPFCAPRIAELTTAKILPRPLRCRLHRWTSVKKPSGG